MENIIIRKAKSRDIDQIKQIADNYRYELGFIPKSVLERDIQRGEIIVAENSRIIGFVHYHHRKDDQTTLYHITVCKEYQGKKIGSILVNALINEARKYGKSRIRLKCPIDLEANKFYKKIGFQKVGIENGKKRKLVIWEFQLS